MPLLPPLSTAPVSYLALQIYVDHSVHFSQALAHAACQEHGGTAQHATAAAAAAVAYCFATMSRITDGCWPNRVLAQVLVGAARTERSGTAQRAFAAAAAAVARYAPDGRVEKLLAEAAAMHSEPGDK